MMVKLKKYFFGMLLLFGSMTFSLPGIFAQTPGKIVSGVVVDAKGDPLIGVSVVLKGTTNGTVTDINGAFSLQGVKAADPAIRVSYVGYVTQEVHPAGTGMKIVLVESAQTLDELVVVGYGTVKKKDLTGAVSSIGGKDLSDKPVPSIGEALQGKAAGVQVINSGAPGSNVTLKIRGLGTINNSDPLVVIDGFPTDLGLNALNAADIETVDILKDASATAIYGARGANGVVMVTTKKGKEGKGQFSVLSRFGVQEVTDVPKMLNASQYAALNNDMLSNAGMTTNPAWSDPTTLGKGTDWLGALFETANMQNHSLSFAGGNDKYHFYFSLGLFDQQGVVRNTSYRRYTFQSNNDAQIAKWFKISNNITFSTDVKKNGEYSIINTMAALPTQTIKDDDGSWSGPTGNSYWYGTIRNPIGTTEKNKSTTNGYNLLANASAEITFFKGLKFKTTGGIDAKFWFNESFTPAYAWKPVAVNVSNKYQSSDRSLTYLWDNYFTYDNVLGKHKVNVMAGTSAQNNECKNMYGSKTGFLYDDINQLHNGTKIETLDGNTTNWSILSFIGRANYSYDDKYLLTATIRRDGSSRFGSENKWGTFPSFSAAWRVTDESWFKKPEFLDNMKLRAGYGATGNQNADLYSFASVYGTGVYNFNGNTVSTLVISKMPNPYIHWEEVQQSNIGIDVGLFKQRLNLSVDGYIKYTDNMLVKMSVPVSTGYSDEDVPYVNAGRMINRGVELSINSLNIKNKMFEWNTVFNLTFNRNKILDLNSDTPLYQNEVSNSFVTIQAEGHPANSFYGYVTDGIFQTADEVKNHAVQVDGSTSPGDIRFKDLNNDGVITEADRTFIGNPNPDFIFSMSNNFKYQNFDLDIYLYGVTGNDIYNGNRVTTEGMASATNQTSETSKRWTGEGTSNSMPRAVYADPNGNNRASDRFIEDGSFLRIRNITLGYSVPKRITGKFGIENIRIYGSCENLATFTKYSGFDPEVGLNGIDLNTYPLNRTFSVGLKLNF